jgi:HD superfamily phosphohydrolase
MTVDRIRDALDAAPAFWDAVHRSMDKIGFNKTYVSKSRAGPLSRRSKFIKDGLWGMMEFSADELSIIDSPLLQRLRRVAQLGLTHLTYPSAEHSRFIHTLGVAHVVKRLIGSIADVHRKGGTLRSGDQDYPYYNPAAAAEQPVLRSLVHAALLHDCGHLAYSHAGETAFKNNVGLVTVGGLDLEDFVGIFREAGFLSDLSECLSIAIVLSPRFEAFYRSIVGDEELWKRIAEICSFIGGIPHDPKYPGLASIISGAAVDADKIDYINRDARECGIPVGVDVSRVFLNSALVLINPEQAALLARSRRAAEAPRFVHGWHFVVNSTGIDTYDELANAKSVLYHRVYLHQLTRNAEQVLSAAVRAAVRIEADDVRDVFDWFALGDDELLARLSDLTASRSLAMRLIYRELPKRAFSLFRDACEPFVQLQDVFDPAEWSSKGEGGRLQELDVSYARRTAWKLFSQIVPVDPNEQPRRIEEFRQSVRTTAIALRSATEAGSFDPASLGADEPFIGFAPRVTIKPISEVLVREKNSIGYSAQWTKSEELTTADNVARGVDYIYADSDWLIYVAGACVRVLYDFHAGRQTSTLRDPGNAEMGYEDATFNVVPRLNVKIEDICSRIGLDASEVSKMLQKAAEANMLGSAERIAPLTPALAARCPAIAARYGHFQGEHGWRVTEKSVVSFVRQFPVRLRGEVLGLLEAGEILGRSMTREAVDGLSAEAESAHAKKLLICRFSPNSGNFTGMIVEQERRSEYEKKGRSFARSVGELEAHLTADPDRCVLFVDDQFATGGQAEAQLLQWTGTPRKEWPEAIRGEQNIDLSNLSPKTAEFFKNGKVILGFVSGTASGKARIEAAAAKLGLGGLEVRYAHELRTNSLTMSADLRAFLQDVGTALLGDIRHPDGSMSDAQAAAVAADALGYGGAASLMVTPFSAPSHTLSAFWCPGRYQGESWIPLFLRRGYRKHLFFS